MKTPGDYFGLLMALAIFIAIGYSLVFGIKFFIGQFGILGTEATAQLVIISVILIICALIIAAAIRGNQLKNDKIVLPDKAKLYSEFVNYYVETAKIISEGGAVNYRFRSDMALWAGKDVLKAYMYFVNYLDGKSPESKRVFELGEKVILEMRKDIGHQNYRLKAGDLNNLVFSGDKEIYSTYSNDKNQLS